MGVHNRGTYERLTHRSGRKSTRIETCTRHTGVGTGAGAATSVHANTNPRDKARAGTIILRRGLQTVGCFERLE